MTTFPRAPLSETDYYALEDALLSTEKGRRFLRAYVDRNRGMETLRLLRSISRMHRAALGVPGANSEVCRDLTGVLKIISSRREKTAVCGEEAAKSEALMAALEEIEACVIALIESIEDRMAGPLRDDGPSEPQLDSPLGHYSPDRTAKLFGELSSYFSAEPL
ncbi:MAG: hypothetical protein WAN43_15250 [Rhodomicrobium sp.]